MTKKKVGSIGYREWKEVQNRTDQMGVDVFGKEGSRKKEKCIRDRILVKSR